MEKETKPLKAFSIQQIESAIASAISELTNTDTKVNISLLKNITNSSGLFIGQEHFELALSIHSEVPYSQNDNDVF